MKSKLVVLSMLALLAACSSGKSDGYYGGGSGNRSTIIKQKIDQLNDELGVVQKAQATNSADLMRIKEKIIGDVSKYYETIGGISARLQLGTTAGNPVLKEKWRAADAQLGAAAVVVEDLRRLSAQVGSDSSLTDYIKDSSRLAFGISGATEEDHNTLRALTAQVDQVAETARRMSEDIDGEVSRHEKFIASERRKLHNLAGAINVGSETESAIPVTVPSTPRTQPRRETPAPAPAPREEPKPAPAAARPAKAPIVTVDASESSFDEKVYGAIQSVLDKTPNAKFEVIGIAPSSSSRASAQSLAQKISDSLLEMGMPKARLRTATRIDASADSASVGIYVQ